METYCLNLPYNDVVGKINQAVLDELMEICSGEHSVFSLYNSYNYGFYLSVGGLREIFKGIALVKKTHFDKLCEAIVAFEGLPLISGKKIFWSGKNVVYSSGKNQIALLIEKERLLLQNLERVIESSQNQSLKKLLARIIMDSQLHLTLLKGLL